MRSPPAAAPPAVRPPAREGLHEALAAFTPVDASLLDRRTLLRRVDTKFLLRVEALPPVLRALSPSHGIVLAGGERVATYETLYLDAPDLRAYDDHVRGRVPRHKVRARHYPERRVSFLEVKTRTNRSRTEKVRRPHPFGEAGLADAEVAWALALTGWPGETLLPQAWTRFQRITLVALDTAERVTVDLDLRLDRRCVTRRLHGLAIVEVKQPRPDPRSPAVLALRRAGARARSISKYAVAVGLLAAGVRRSRDRNRDHAFTLVAIDVVTFMFCFMLRNVNIELGFALGLFAVLGILRYRTEPVGARDLTYLFLAIGLAILNAVGFNKRTSLVESLLADGVVVAVAALLERIPATAHGATRSILYDQVALLAPGREGDLHADLAARTGLAVRNVRVERLDLLRDAAEITVRFDAPCAAEVPLPDRAASRRAAG